jgi:hypothetical protein
LPPHALPRPTDENPVVEEDLSQEEVIGFDGFNADTQEDAMQPIVSSA